jgi:predicted DNA-binding transcriptional regulator YafY
MIQKDLDIIRHGLKFDLFHSLEGYWFEDLPKLPTLQYSFAEALSLWLSVHAAKQALGMGSSELSAAIARLEALFPPEVARLLTERVAHPLAGEVKTHRQDILAVLGQALALGRKLRMEYKTGSRGGEASERTVRPYHLMPYVRSWHLIAYCELRSDVRIFKIDRITNAVMIDEPYTIPKSFQLDDYLGLAWGVVRDARLEPVHVVLRFNAEAGRWAAEEHWHKTQETEIAPDGDVIFRLHLPITSEFINWVLYYGPHVEVVEPERLRELVAEAHCRAAALYNRSPASPR